jgi:glycerol-3-phosphate dehydrogenase
MNRSAGLTRLSTEAFDVLVVGGGATGLGCALDAASRGYRTALIEAADFAQGTSSRSTKLIHGGVRYLRTGNFVLVREALTERATLLRNAPALVRPLEFYVPAAQPLRRLYYAAGLRLYDALARHDALPRSRLVPGGISYYDAQFDDARLAIAIAQTAVVRGAAISNYVRAQSFLYDDGRIAGVTARNEESGVTFDIRAKTVINAAGIFADVLRALDDAAAAPLLTFSRGTHVVVPARFLNDRERALLVPSTDDGRVLFALPWHGCALLGTTDVRAPSAELEPQATDAEIDWILRAFAPFGNAAPARGDITAVFCGLRPLLRRSAAGTAQLSREHAVVVSRSGLVTIAGGKWTTYRKMAEDAVDAAAEAVALPPRPSRTRDLPLANVPAVPAFEHAVRREMARTIGDVLARRSRTLFFDAASALENAPQAANVLAAELHLNSEQRAEQLRRFRELARRYMPVS